MRNIEEIAAEEGSRVRAIWKARFKTAFWLAGLGLGVWGWILFRQGQMDKGALMVLGSFVLFGTAWDAWEIFQEDLFSQLIGLAAAIGPFFLYFYTHCPFFYWGKDPSFWLAIHGGAVVEPFWSPFSYLLGQAACFLFPQMRFWILPELTGTVMACGLYFTGVDIWHQLKNRTLLNALLVLLVCWGLGVSYPFWNAATLGSGLVAASGFWLFLLQRRLLDRDEKPWKALYLIQGLLWSVHPLWGIIGLWNHLGNLDTAGKKMASALGPFILGFTPYFWIIIRTHQFFPSWGGEHPFFELFRKWRGIWETHFDGDWALWLSLRLAGLLAAVWLLSTLVLWTVHFFKWRTGNKKVLPSLDFWTWLAAGTGAVLFYSESSRTLGPSALWFMAGLGGFFLKLLEKGLEKRQPEFFSGPILGWIMAAVLSASMGLGWYWGETCFRSRTDFPEQHALNLLKELGDKSVLVCEDPFEASACLETRLIEPVATEAPILAKRSLVQRWYVAQCIERYPGLLFSTADGQADKALKSFVENNRDDWEIHWALSELPKGWGGPKAFPTVLTQLFGGKAVPAEDEGRFQYRYDLSSLLSGAKDRDTQFAHYSDRYVTGFEALGKDLMDQGKYTDSIRAFERALLLDPTATEAKKELTLMYSQKNIIEAARLDFEKTVRDDPQRVSALMVEMEKAEQGKDEAKTAGLLDEIVRLNTQLADAQFQLSKIYDQQGRTQDAKALLEASVQSDPRRLESQMKLGHLMARLGNRIRAEEAYRQVLTIDPQNKEAQVEIWKLLNQK